MPTRSRPIGIVLLSLFFELGSLFALLACVSLLIPGSALEPIWRLNPQAHTALAGLGAWAVVLMAGVATACGTAALGLWAGRRWGHRMALAVLTANLVGDAANALLRGDPRTLIGLPIGGLLVAYLLSEGVRDYISKSELSAH